MSAQSRTKTILAVAGQITLQGDFRVWKREDLFVVQQRGALRVLLDLDTHYSFVRQSTTGFELKLTDAAQNGDRFILNGQTRPERLSRYASTAVPNGAQINEDLDYLTALAREGKRDLAGKADVTALEQEIDTRIATDQAETQARIAADEAEVQARIAAVADLQKDVAGARHLESFVGASNVAPTTRRTGSPLQVGDRWHYLGGPEDRTWNGTEFRSGTLPNSSPTAQIASDAVMMTTTGTVNDIVAGGIIGGLGPGDNKLFTMPSRGYNTGPVFPQVDGAPAVELKTAANRSMYAGQAGPLGYPMLVLRTPLGLRLLNPHQIPQLSFVLFDGVDDTQVAYRHTNVPYGSGANKTVTLVNHGYRAGNVIYYPAVGKSFAITGVMDPDSFVINDANGDLSGIGGTLDIYRCPLKLSSGNVHSVVKAGLAGRYFINLRQPINLEQVAVTCEARGALIGDFTARHGYTDPALLFPHSSPAFGTSAAAILVQTLAAGVPTNLPHISVEVRG
jgi:hypothetical protein